MNDNLLSNEQWAELWEAIKLFDQKGDRTVLNRVLVSIMNNVVESLDDEFQTNEKCDTETQLVITLIESELAEIRAIDASSSWFRRRRRIQSSNRNNCKLSDYLINIARVKSFDKNNSGFISKEIIHRIFGAQLSNDKMTELMQLVETDNKGNVNYKDFATLMLITK